MLCINFLISDDKKGENYSAGFASKRVKKQFGQVPKYVMRLGKRLWKKWFGFGRSLSYIMHLM